MKQYKNLIWSGGLGMVFAMMACSHDSEIQTDLFDRDEMTFEVHHPSQTSHSRVTDTAFEDNDRVGLFVVTKNQPLEVSGNYVNNASLTYSNNEWTSAKPIYWNKGSYDVYAYFPYENSVASVDDMEFSVSLDQSVAANYVASDFLWAGKKNVTAGNGDISLQFTHRMSRLVIQLVKGEDYEGELPDEAEVFVHNTVPSATVDLNVGIVTPDKYGSAKTIRAKSLGSNKYTAIVVPQRLNNRQPLVEVIMKGVSYLYESKFLFKQGMQHNVQLMVTKNPEQVKIEIGGEIETWN
ncbi:MAG: fimbrillin family protein [Parabacteroides sp.]|nr:fimbrillin family protein [Parabacteroides sp.]